MGNDGTGNGTWTLFFADLTRGGGQAYLDSWTLNLTVVPEPVTLALGRSPADFRKLPLGALRVPNVARRFLVRPTASLPA